MTKTQADFKRAEKKYQENLEETTLDLQKAMVTKGTGSIPTQSQYNRYREIKTKLITHFSEESIKTIMFTSTAHGDGSSFTAVSFATTLALDCRLNVLIMDANLRCPRLHEIFNIEYRQGVSNLLTKDEDKTSFIKKVGHGGLYFTSCGENNSDPMNLFESTRFEKSLKIMRKKFDYVILDTPPVNGYGESIVIATKVDGVILVLESDKTRQQVALRAKEEMEKAGANVLGVILNKRKHYIPEWIYKRL
jgi:capsular exopolysaccharide synthesis family protein